nr:MAG TPA: hypothetical protein [Caudoviricetes sp.]
MTRWTRKTRRKRLATVFQSSKEPTAEVAENSAKGRDSDVRKEQDMDNKVIEIVRSYIVDHLDKSDRMPEFDVFVVWKCRALQNWKYLLSSTLFDGMYYEMTYNGDKKEWYLDAYKKFENRCIPD